MPTLQTTCSHCDAALDLAPEQLLLAVYRDATADYSFQCTECHRITVRPAPPQLVQALVGCGVVPTTADATGHPEAPPSGPPLSLDDLLDLHEALERDDWFDRLVATCHVASNSEEASR